MNSKSIILQQAAKTVSHKQSYKTFDGFSFILEGQTNTTQFLTNENSMNKPRNPIVRVHRDFRPSSPIIL